MHTKRKGTWHFPTVKKNVWWPWLQRASAGAWPRVHSRLSNTDLRVENPEVSFLSEDHFEVYGQLTQPNVLEWTLIFSWKAEENWRVGIPLPPCRVQNGSKVSVHPLPLWLATAAWLPREAVTWVGRKYFFINNVFYDSCVWETWYNTTPNI